jgi:hypothetical protein
MEDSKLTQLIAESKEKVAAEEAERQTLVEAQQSEFDRLMAEASTARLAETKDIPAALLPYCLGYRGSEWDLEDQIGDLKIGWLPERFLINAPDLAPMTFTIAVEWDDKQPPRLTGQFIIETIKVEHSIYYNLHQAIAAAAEKQRDNQERKKADEQVQIALYNSSQEQPSIADQLYSLIRQMIQIEIEEF